MKRSNLRTQNGQTVLIDFDLACEMDENGYVDAYGVGTNEYRAPETYDKNKECTSAIDLYSMGKTIEKMSRRVQWKTSDSDGCVKNLNDLIGQLCDESPSRRPTASEALGHPFFQSS